VICQVASAGGGNFFFICNFAYEMAELSEIIARVVLAGVERFFCLQFCIK